MTAAHSVSLSSSCSLSPATSWSPQPAAPCMNNQRTFGGRFPSKPKELKLMVMRVLLLWAKLCRMRRSIETLSTQSSPCTKIIWNISNWSRSGNSLHNFNKNSCKWFQIYRESLIFLTHQSLWEIKHKDSIKVRKCHLRHRQDNLEFWIQLWDIYD